MSSALVALGYVTRAHGIRGELRVHLYNSDSTILAEQSHVILRKQGIEKEMQLHAVRMVPKAALLALIDVTSRDAAEAYRGYEVCVERNALPELPSDEYYINDLVGAEVYEQGVLRGTVSDVIEYPSVLCLQVRNECEMREVPLLDDFVLNIDIAAGRIEIKRWNEFEVQEK